jgi:hypothetical protein
VLDMTADDRDWFLKRLGGQRRDEAAALRKGRKE